MTSGGGQAEVMHLTSPKEDKEVCSMLGHANETAITVGGVDCQALIDTGSQVTTISEDFYRSNLEVSHPLLDIESGIRVEGAGGNSLSFVGIVEVGIKCPGVEEELMVPALVMPATPYNQRIPAIIGTNVLSRIKDLSSAAGPLKESAALISNVQGQEMEDVNLYSSGSVTLPAGKVSVISARIGAARGFSFGTPTIVDTLPGGVGIPSTVVGLDSKNVKLCLLNMTDHEVQIPKLQKIATIQPARVIDHNISASREVPSQEVPEKKGVETSSPGSSQPRDVPVNLDDTDLTEEQKTEVMELLRKYSDVFAFSKSELGTAKGVKHSIRLTDPHPFKDRPRRIPPAFYKEVKDHIEEMLACGAIRRSNSPWCSNVVLVRKQDGSLRLCLDFRRLNSRTIQDAYHIPRIEETLDRLSGSSWYSCLDLQTGYWQVEMNEEDKDKTAFCVGGSLGGNLGNLFECNRMPFGLTNAPATFQRLMESTLGDLPFCQVYLDDIIIFSSTFAEQLIRLEHTFQRLRDCGLKLKPSKCHLFKRRVKYLGHIISEDGIETDNEKIKVIQEWPIPSTVQELRRALGFFGYYRRYVKGYSTIAKPLHDLLCGHENSKGSNKRTSITLDQQALEAFSTLKTKLSEPPVLAYADYSLPFELHTDASQSGGLGAILYQRQDNKLRVIAYASRGLKPSETRYPAHKLEFLAMKWAICDKFQDYLYGHRFEVLTDNNPLSYVLTTAKLDATGHRWLAELSTYNFSIKYRSGSLNVAADALSRLHEIKEESVKAICNGLLVTQEDAIGDIMCFSMQSASVQVSEAAGHLTVRDWIRLQKEEEIIRIVHEAVIKKRKPSKDMVSLHPDLRIFMKDWDKLFIKDGVLYRHSRSSTGEERQQLVLPTCKRQEVLRGLHNDLGHMGRDRTTELVRSRFFWPRLARDVTNWIRLCEPCIKRKVAIPDCAALVNIRTTQPLELVCIDYLSLEASKGGIENVLVITDHFTRFAYAVPTRNQTAKTTATALYQFFLHYGYPKYLHSDQGKNFTSTTIKELCALAGITKTRTTPYHAMGNGMTERFNATLLNMLGTLEDDKKKDWKTYVPALVQAYNSTRHDSTGYSPFYLMLGRHPRLPIDIVMGLHPEEDRKETDYVNSLRKRLQYAFDLATKTASKSAGTHKRYYDRRIRGGTVEVGDRVLVRNTGIRGKHKIANRWEDIPYKVVHQPDPNIPVFEVLQEGKRSATRMLHRNMLLPINFLPLPDGASLDSTVPAESRQKVPKREEKKQRTEVDSETDDNDDGDDYDGDRRESEEESDDSDEYSLNPLAQEFHPQQPISTTSSTSSASGLQTEDPQVAEFVEQEVDEEETVSVDQEEDVVEEIQGEATSGSEDEQVPVVEEETGAVEEVVEVEEDVEDEVVVEGAAEGGELESDNVEEDSSSSGVEEEVEETVRVAPTPAPRYPSRNRNQPVRYEDNWRMKSHVVSSPGPVVNDVDPYFRMLYDYAVLVRQGKSHLP